MSLNGRIVGKMGDKILVALSMEEYLEALPRVSVSGAEGGVIDVETVADRARRFMRDERIALAQPGRPPGKAAAAQRRFNGSVRKPAPKKGEVAKLAPRECSYCKKQYNPVRRDQTFCLAPACKKAKDAAYRESHKKPGGKKTTPPPAAPAAVSPPVDPSRSRKGLTPEQKEERLKQIRQVAKRVGFGHPRPGIGAAAGEPAELAQARREAVED